MNLSTVTAIPCMACLLLCLSCQNEPNPTIEPLSDEQISSNLLTMGGIDGSIDPQHLIGEWNLVKFAYTADGKEISNITTVSGGWLKILFAPTPVEHCVSDRWMLHCTNTMNYTCSISGNFIELEGRGSTYIHVPLPNIEIDAERAFANAYSFVINGNELIIHFKRIDDKKTLSNCVAIENKNLIIFQKR
ncbi:MAG: hypothetical protein FWE30_06595 [Bacteroidales bacterium]|nr:hypothetical protein [Bacteroidales bacterium]